ncbi:unnamed protein product [Pedinophyceae sp. YPF-701]|nr:unnamed protein product [Pedinophyceae sp. YPF-701]
MWHQWLFQNEGWQRVVAKTKRSRASFYTTAMLWMGLPVAGAMAMMLYTNPEVFVDGQGDSTQDKWAMEKQRRIQKTIDDTPGYGNRSMWNQVQRDRLQALLDDLKDPDSESSKQRYVEAISGRIDEPESIKARTIVRR